MTLAGSQTIYNRVKFGLGLFRTDQVEICTLLRRLPKQNLAKISKFSLHSVLPHLCAAVRQALKPEAHAEAMKIDTSNVKVTMWKDGKAVGK